MHYFYKVNINITLMLLFMVPFCGNVKVRFIVTNENINLFISNGNEK